MLRLLEQSWARLSVVYSRFMHDAIIHGCGNMVENCRRCKRKRTTFNPLDGEGFCLRGNCPHRRREEQLIGWGTLSPDEREAAINAAVNLSGAEGHMVEEQCTSGSEPTYGFKIQSGAGGNLPSMDAVCIWCKSPIATCDCERQLPVT